MTEAKRIIVNTTKDSGLRKGDISLRMAINEVNKYFIVSGHKRKMVLTPYYIDFEAKTGETRAWIISPETPLPPILYRNVFINFNNPKFVTLTGESLKKTN